ncbi:hypothetical protein [Prochlorococcus marinus]|uniref:hypothetical protein n=1 Tax=Prochlorococcus marinus TaxID=1219 RepID=UPI0022B5AD94|nr:hypothetical protein [Prochlorococcus marinus]
MNISQSSPLYEYWNSDQVESDENKRLLKLNSKEPASNLFRNEPYKWENLYQSVLRNVISGDDSSIKGLMVLLSTISTREKNIVLNSLEALLDKHVIYKLRYEKYQDIKSRKNFYTAFRILLAIFINPYNLELKKEPKHLYEKTGMFFYNFRKIVLSNK